MRWHVHGSSWFHVTTYEPGHVFASTWDTQQSHEDPADVEGSSTVGNSSFARLKIQVGTWESRKNRPVADQFSANCDPPILWVLSSYDYQSTTDIQHILPATDLLAGIHVRFFGTEKLGKSIWLVKWRAIGDLHLNCRIRKRTKNAYKGPGPQHSCRLVLGSELKFTGRNRSPQLNEVNKPTAINGVTAQAHIAYVLYC